MVFPGKNTGVGCHFRLQGIFLTQGWNPYFLHCRQIYYSWASREAQEVYKVTSKATWKQLLRGLSRLGSGPPVGLRPGQAHLHLNRGHSHLLCNLGWVSKSTEVWVSSAASEPCFQNSKGSEWAQRKAASHQLFQPCTVRSRFLKLRVMRSFWIRGDAEVEKDQRDGKNPKQDQNPKDAKHDHPVLSITSHSLRFEGLLASLTMQGNPHSASYPHRCDERTHWKRPRCWERSKAGEGNDRQWGGPMSSPTRWTWVWIGSRSWWWTGRPGVHGVTESWTWLSDWTKLSCPHISANISLV